jgi:simple sugar transport system ATP-binding protein
VHHAHGVSLADVSLAVRGGEVLGIAGIAGNGQDEFFAALSGEVAAPHDGAVAIDGVAVGRAGITERRRRGAAFVPEERLGHGAAPSMRLTENALLSGHATNGFVRRGLIDRARLRGFVDGVVRAFDVRKGPADPEARALSGGNLQKFVIGREIARRPGVLVVAQPSWGVDAGAAAAIRQALMDLARGGSAVLVISQDLDELLEISDRLAVMFMGRLSPAMATELATREAVGLLMGGEGITLQCAS